ncbi:MAG: RNA polymerase sigma factor [Chloroflexi bacterium]|nr:MAG: RNA polymerase sigma factor [Chloroflexota bacterium]
MIAHTATRDEDLAVSRRPRPAGSLAERLAEDLDGVFEDVVVEHQHALFAFVAGLGGDPGQAEEVVQDAFVRAHRALTGYPPERVRELRLRPWLFRIALNALRNRLRGRRVQLVLLDRPPDGADPAPGPETEAMRRADRARLGQALVCLPQEQRAAVLLRFAHDLGYARIAEVLDRPVGTVKSDVHRGLVALRRRMGAEVEV